MKARPAVRYYDYEQLPLDVADAAFAEFIQDHTSKDLLELPDVLIRHCDRWCQQNSAFSGEDRRVAVLLKLQAYLHEKYSAEISQLMKSNIASYQQQQERITRLYERRN